MNFVRLGLFGFIYFTGSLLRGQSTVPTLLQAIPAQALSPGGPSVMIDLRSYFGVPGLVGTQFALFDTVLGRFGVELRNDAAPRQVANFLTYVQAGDYTNSFFHRGASFNGAPASSIVQGGGYRLPLVTEIVRRPTVPLEYNLANARGTLAAARTSDPNSASSEWYFNTIDNSTTLGPQTVNGVFSPGYTVFGRVLGTGMSVVDLIAALPRSNQSGTNNPEALFGSLPVRNYTSGNATDANLVIVTSLREATLFPAGGGVSIVDFSAENSAPTVINLIRSGSTLIMAPVSTGTANVTIRAVDINGNAATGTFSVNVAAGAPVFTLQPAAQTVAAGSTVVFNASATGAGSYRWERNGVAVPNATSETLVLKNVAAADGGNYVSFASSSLGVAQSATAALTVVNLAPTDVGHLVNLSILTSAGAGAKVLTMGAFVGGGGSSDGLQVPLPLVIRAVGPTLAQPPFNVSGVLPDPVMTFYAAGNTTPLDANDNWGGGAVLTAAFRSVAAFDLPGASLDSAIARTTPGAAPGGYTVQVTGKGDASGVVIAEMYDASGTARTATTPRLINLSTRAQIDPGTDLAVGFVLGGQSARTVLVRGVGPSLAAFGLGGLMADPRLELFSNNNGQRVASNDDWAGSTEIATSAASVGAFALAGASSKDAVLLVTLPPGPYSARISGVGGTGGTALVEVYEVP